MSLPMLAKCMGIVPVTPWSAASATTIKDAEFMRTLLVALWDGADTTDISYPNWLSLL